MVDDFLRAVTRGSVNSYPKHGTDDEKLDSTLVKHLRRSSDISVFRVGNGITVERIVAALAATRDYPDCIDYVKFGIGEYVAVPCGGNTPDEGVNAVHYGIHDLNDDEVIGFADMVADEYVTRVAEGDVVDAVRSSIRNGYIRASDVKFNIE